MCVFMSPFVTAIRIPADICALEVYLRGDDPREYDRTIERHPLLNGNRYGDLFEFVMD